MADRSRASSFAASASAPSSTMAMPLPARSSLRSDGATCRSDPDPSRVIRLEERSRVSSGGRQDSIEELEETLD